MINQPYIKQYDKENLPVPLKEDYIHFHLNRKERRKKIDTFIGNSKNYHLTVLNNSKYKRVIQEEVDKEGKRKFIYHYILA